MNGASKHCARCGTPLPIDSPLDACPRCLAACILVPDTASAASIPEIATTAPNGPLEQVGERIGRYKLLEKIGEGGCGVVYVAEQSEPVRRRVALKVIKLGMDTRAVVARFEAERQALAMMDHPNIAKVFDGGSTGAGRPFFVMELVRGIRITEYCDENRLSTAQRLELFTQVCHAVQHAHQKGIIHRDLKPSNILVTINDGVPVPKVIDFGVAKAASGQSLTDKTVYTAFEQFIGTPAYMSPEQTLLTSLDIDTRSDIYSLGVLLYELLTGGLPFDPRELQAAGLDEIRRTIREQEPPRPSVRLSTLGAGELTTAAKRRSTDVTRLVHDVRGDLDWIVTRCLEKDRNRRYETANGLAADIQRHLKNEPIIARPPSRLYQFQKLARRNRTAIAAAAAVLVALLAGLAFSTWSLLRERAARREAAVEAAKSERVSKFLKDMLWNMKPSVAMGRDTALLREFAEEAAERLARDLNGHPEVELELRATLGAVFRTIGDDRKAEAMHRETLSRMKSLLGSDHPKLVPLLWDFARVLGDRGKAVEAEALAREALALARQRRGPEHLDVTESLGIIAWSLGRQKRYDEAEVIQRECLELTRRRKGPESRDVAVNMADLAFILGERKPQEAEALYREALAMAKRRLKPGYPIIITVTMNFSQFYVRQKNLEQAEVLLRELLALQRNVLGNENRQVANTLAALAATLIDNGKPAEGEKVARESLALHRRLYGEESLEVSFALHDLGIAMWRFNRFDEAEALLREALAIDRKLLPPDSNELGRSIFNLANLLNDADKLAEAETFFRERLDRARLKPDHDPMDLETRIYDLADRVYVQRKYAQAEPLYRELIQRRSSRLPATNEAVTEPKASLGRLLADWAWMERTNAPAAARALERAQAGEQLLRDCLAVRLQGTNTGSWRISDVRSRLGGAMLSVAVTDRALTDEARQARFAEIEVLLLEGHEGIMPRNSPTSKQKRGTFERLIRLYEAWGKPAQAADWREKLASFEESRRAKEAAATPIPEPPSTP